MKKVLLTLMVLGITSSCTSFGYEIKYMETGAVKNFTPIAFGSNAPWLPGNREMKAQRIREVRRYNAETEAIRNMYKQNINLNINTISNGGNNRVQTQEHTVSLDQNNPNANQPKTEVKKFTSATCNGITYYTKNNPCSL